MHEVAWPMHEAAWPMHMHEAAWPMHEAAWPAHEVAWPMQEAAWPMHEAAWPMHEAAWPTKPHTYSSWAPCSMDHFYGLQLTWKRRAFGRSSCRAVLAQCWHTRLRMQVFPAGGRGGGAGVLVGEDVGCW